MKRTGPLVNDSENKYVRRRVLKKSVIVNLILIVSLFLGSVASAAAETRYVSDELTVLLRGGMGTQYRILRMLNTGTPLTILETHDEYYKVRTRQGLEGYVLKQHITADTPKAIVIDRLEKQIADLREKLAQTEADQKTLRADAETLASTEKELQSVATQLTDLQEKSRGVIELSQQRDLLEAENERLSAEVGELREANDQLFFTAMIKWFLAGGGVFLGGWVIGKVSKKKRGYSF
jgi:SH3 domain protein